MSDFKAKMHQIRFQLGLCPRPNWGAYSAHSDPLAGFKGSTSKEGEGRGEMGEEERGGKEDHSSKFATTPLLMMMMMMTVTVTEPIIILAALDLQRINVLVCVMNVYINIVLLSVIEFSVVAIALAEQKITMEQLHKATVDELQKKLTDKEVAYTELHKKLTQEKEFAVAETKKKQWVNGYLSWVNDG